MESLVVGYYEKLLNRALARLSQSTDRGDLHFAARAGRRLERLKRISSRVAKMGSFERSALYDKRQIRSISNYARSLTKETAMKLLRDIGALDELDTDSITLMTNKDKHAN